MPCTVFTMRPHPLCCIFSTSRVDGALTDLLFLCGRIFAVMDSQCDAFSQVSIKPRCIMIVDVKLFNILIGLVANAVSSMLCIAYCNTYCSLTGQTFFGTGRYHLQYKTTYVGLLSDPMQPYTMLLNKLVDLLVFVFRCGNSLRISINI